eukprot:1062444-Pleurochrysis_carterae.AAC.4
MYLFVLSAAPMHSSNVLADANCEAIAAVVAATAPPIALTHFEARNVQMEKARPQATSPQATCSPLPLTVPLHPTGFMKCRVQLDRFKRCGHTSTRHSVT